MQLICLANMHVVLLKDERGISIVNVFKKWVDQGGQFKNYLFKRFLKNNNIVMYSISNEGTSVVAERFSRI